MARDPSEGLMPQKGKFADVRTKLKNLPLAERAAFEVRLAKEFGITITPAQLTSVGTPSFGRTRIENHPMANSAADGKARRDWGGIDLDVRSSMSGSLQAVKGLAIDQDVDAVRQAIEEIEKNSTEYGISSLAYPIAELHAQLEMLAMRGDHPELVAKGQTILSKAIFRIPASEASSSGVGGTPNR